MTGEALSHLAMCEGGGVVFRAGYRDGAVYCERLGDLGRTRLAFGDGGEQSLVGRSDDDRPAIEVFATGELLVCVTDGGRIVTYLSEDGGETWVQDSVL